MPARADDSATRKAPATQVEEVVVTSQHRREQIQKVPVAVTALTAASMTQRGIQKTEDLAASVPSLSVTQLTAGPETVQISLRGAVEQTGGLITSESPVALYIDDVYQARLSSANIDMGDIERVEVLRGPQGTLYGRNSMTGAVQFVTRQPDGSTWLDAALGYGSYNEARGQFSGGTSLAEHLAGSLSAVFDTKDGWQRDEVLNKNVGGNSDIGIRGALSTVNTGDFSATLRAGYVYEFGQGVYFTPVNAVTNAPQVAKFGDTNAPQEDHASSRTYSTSLNMNYDLGDVQLKSITAFQYLTDTWGLDFSGGYELAPGAAPETGFFRQSDADEHQFTQEFRATGDTLGGRLKYIGGLFFFTERANQTLNDTIGSYLFGQPDVYHIKPTNYSTSSSSYAAYGQADYLITKKLTFTAGVRFSEDRKRFEGSLQDGLTDLFGGPPAAIVTVPHTKIDNTVVTPKFTLSYQITNDLLAYATIARGYRAGGFNGLAVADPSILGKPYAPEKDWSYEVGSKLSLFHHQLTFNAAAYYETITNLQETVATSDGSFATENAAQAHIDGLEFEFQAVPFDDVHLYGNLSLTDDKYDQLQANTEAAEFGATQLPLLAHVQAQIGGNWKLHPAFTRGYPLVLAADYAYKSPYYGDAENSSVSLTSSSNRLNASLTILTPDEKWSLTASGRNVTDAHYYFSGISFITGLVSSKFPSETGQWLLTLKYHY